MYPVGNRVVVHRVNVALRALVLGRGWAVAEAQVIANAGAQQAQLRPRPALVCV